MALPSLVLIVQTGNGFLGFVRTNKNGVQMCFVNEAGPSNSYTEFNRLCVRDCLRMAVGSDT